MAEVLKTAEEKEACAEKPRRVFVEIGPGPNPVSTFGRREFGENDIYVGIDLSHEDLVLHVGDRKSSKGKNQFFVEASARQLPIPDKSVDEIYLGNVFGHPLYSVPRFSAYKELMLAEAARVLRKGGRIIFAETNTPDCSEEEDLEERLRFHGFSIERVIRLGDAEWEREMSVYNVSAAKDPPKGSYILFAEKKGEHPKS